MTGLGAEGSGQQAEEPRLRYVPAIDGLRALAVSAVFAYHAGIGWARGGFLGVDVFFVISGYLITALLLTDHRRTGRIRLLRFWRRRARRLLPALFLLLVGVSIAVPLLATDQGYRLRADVLAALGYVSNWRLIFEHQSYFQSLGRPPLLQHLWSLAVEEQFYLLWPLVLALLLRWREPRRLVGPILGLAAASAALMAVLHDPTADPSRVYFGTDTRVAGILVGAALACVPIRWKSADRQLSRAGRVAVEVAGGAVLWGLWLCLSRVDQFDPLLYRGGFLGAAVLAAAAIVLATHPRSWVASGLGSRPLVWLGKRSYAVYLWFWPVFMLTRPHSDVPLTGIPLLALRMALTLALACASYTWVEKPIRDGALGRVWADLRAGVSRRSRPSRTATRWALGSAFALVAVSTAVFVGHPVPAPPFAVPAASASTPAPASASASAVPAVPVATVDTAVPSVPSSAVEAVVEPAPAPVPVPDPAPPPEPPPPPPPPPGPPPGTRVTAIGESVMIVAQPAMEAEGIYVDAVIGRQFAESLAVAHSLRDSGGLGEIVVVHLGNNGPVTEGQFDELMDTLSVARRVVVVNLRVPRPWEEHNNNLFASAVPRFPNAVLVDWHAVGDSHPDAFVDDGVHMTHDGVGLYVDLLHSGMA
ncbi:MAG TPA: acyltransferase family protein [Acidimicrobiales bacterium]